MYNKTLIVKYLYFKKMVMLVGWFELIYRNKQKKQSVNVVLISGLNFEVVII